MKKLIQISTLCLTLFACIPASQAATSNDDLFWNLKLQNRNACARESKEPARGFYLYVDGVTFGRAAAKVARNGKQDIGTSVQKAWTELHRSLLITTQSVVEAMLANRLPLVESPSAVDAAKLVAALETASLLDVDQRCQEIKKPLPMAAGDVNPTARSLTVLAQSYLKADEFIGKCSSIAQREAGSASLALKWNLVRELKNGDQKLTFEFWQSFKIYLSAAWKLGVFKKHAPQFGAWLQSFPIEEMTLLIADGCQSLSRPACNSDFLSEAQLSTFASTTEFKRSALLGRSFTDGLLNSDASSKSGSVPPLEDSASFLKNLNRARQQSAQTMFESQTRLTALFNQKSVSSLSEDIRAQASQANTPETRAQIESACVENRVFSDSKISAFAQELQANRALVSRLDQMGFPGAQASQNLSRAIDLAKSFTELCSDKSLQTAEAGDGSAGSMAWLKDYFSSVLTAEAVNEYLHMAPAAGPGRYVVVANEVVCTDPVDCWRMTLESAARLYQVSLSSDSLMSDNQVQSTDIGKTASQVACRIYDPWAANHVRFKKLLLDTASAVATATLQIPLYLDLKPSTPKVASFTQLVEDDTIKLDPVFYKQGWKKTMFADLSGFAKAPCTISVSENAQILPGDRTLLYKGISAAVCTSKSETVSDQDSASVSRGESKRQSVCGSCSINFATVSTAFVRRGFGTLGAGLKMVTAVAQFFQAGNDPSAKAKTKTINVAHVVAAYQRYGLIPDRCVKDLAKGKVCEEKREPTRVTKRTSK